MQLWSSDKTDMAWSWGGVGGRVGGGQGLECLVRETWIWRSLGQTSSVQFSCSVVSDSLSPSVQFSCSVVSDSLQPQEYSIPGFPVHHQLPRSLLKLMSIKSVMPSNHLILCHSLLSCLQSFPASGCFPVSQFFASGGQSIRASSSASVLPIEYSGLISFRTDWFDLLAVQGTLNSVLQYHSSKASKFSALSFLYYPTHTSIQNHWKNHSFD